MCSRIREKPEKLFEVFIEVAKPSGDDAEIVLVQKYPPAFTDEKVLKDAPKFAFPCDTERYTTTVDHFTFVLTDLDSKYTFGFCRHATGAQTCLCIVSYLPWFEVFYSILNTVAEAINRSDDNNVTDLLRAAYSQQVPAVGIPVTIVAGQEMLSFTAPDINKLPKIPDNRNLTEYYNAIDTSNMMQIFASLLNERRIIVTSKKLSRLTACVHASVGLVYPMHWQHLYIPILPSYLIDYVTAPMPFVIGIHSTLMERVQKMEIGDAVILDADSNILTSEYDDFECLPYEVSSYLKRHLKGDKLRTNMMTSADAIPKSFLMALVKLIGGYRDALKFQPGEEITFDPEAFVQSRPHSMQSFLENMLHLQLFQQFINGRLDMLNSGIGFSDVFEEEATQHEDKLNTQSRYKEWLGNMKKQGKKLQRGGKDVWSDFKDKAAPVMSNAMQSVKSHGKKAYSGFKTKIGELRKEDDGYRSKSVKQIPHTKLTGISPNRPSTIITGQELKTRRPPRPMQKSPSSPKPGSQTAESHERISRYKLIEEKSLDDTDLPYNRVSINLLNDPDIQFAINKSASAEDIAHTQGQDAFLIESDESSDDSCDITPKQFNSVLLLDCNVKSEQPINLKQTPLQQMPSQQTSLQQTPSQQTKQNIVQTKVDDLKHIPFIDLTNSESDKRSRKSDSNIAIARPVAPPRKTRQHQAIGDRLISGTSKPPKPVPRRSLSREQPTLPQKPLIHLESAEFEETFDPFAASGSQTVGQLDILSQLQTSPQNTSHDTVDQSTSINRTPAFKKGPLETPKRNSVKPDISPLSDESFIGTDDVKDVFDFDPLNPSFPAGSHGNKSTDMNDNNNQELLKSWDLQHFSSPNISRSSNSWTDVSRFSGINQTSSGRLSNQFTTGNPPDIFPVLSPQNKTPPMVPPRPTPQSVEDHKRTSFGNAYFSTGASVGSGGAKFSSSSSNVGILQPQNIDSSEKQDPFADLVSIPKTASLNQSPQKQKWQTFD